MWIIRFHLLQTKHYNKINRIFKKYGFVPRKASALTFAKASLLHHTQKISWRSLARQFWVDHSALFRFDEYARENAMHKEIFHVFFVAQTCLFIGDNRVINIQTLDNNQEIYNLTKVELESILDSI